MIYIKLLNDHSDYSTFANSQNFITPNITFCDNEQHMHYNPEIIISASLLDILYSDVNGNLSYTSEILPISEGKTPIALCIAGTNFFGVNEPARWMSLKYMNCDTPENGSLTKTNIGWGNQGIDIETIDNITTTYINGGTSGYLTASWIHKNNIPSLFNENNEWNISILGAVNQYGVTDIDGKNKTMKIATTATSQSNWQTDNVIQNQGNGYTPIVCCCLRYHTQGTNAGDWYLPAGGELSMIIIMRDEINAKLSLISEIYSTDCINSLGSDDYWTSTECNADTVYCIGTYDGGMGQVNKYADHPSMALLQY